MTGSAAEKTGKGKGNIIQIISKGNSGQLDEQKRWKGERGWVGGGEGELRGGI